MTIIGIVISSLFFPGACGGPGEEKCLKSKADYLYNPNIYHSIEDLKPSSSKKEPFYDEVKDRNIDSE